MVDAVFVITIIAVLIVCIIAFRLMEGVSQALLMFNIVFFVILVIAAVIVLNDFRTYNDSFSGREKIVLIDDNGKLAAAYKWQGNMTKPLDITAYAQAFGKNDYASVIKEKQMIWVIKAGLLKDKNLSYSSFL